MNTPGTIRTKAEQGITFAVDAVDPATEAMPIGSLGDSVELRSGCSIRVMPDRQLSAVAPRPMGPIVSSISPPSAEPAQDSAQNPAVRRQYFQLSFIHPLIEAVHVAFSEHRPLVLSPDSIWLVIAQGFGHHVREEGEILRSRLVRHAAGKRLLGTVMAPEEANWQSFVSQMSEQIREHTDPVLHETLLCDFSTSTISTRVASEVVLMNTYARFFEYHMLSICGIPEVTIQGTVDDWQRMRDRIEVLATFGLEWWLSRVRPILDQLVRTANGSPNRDFWKAIYKPKQTYGTEPSTGWIVDLFPYLGDPPRCRVNPVFDTPRVDWVVPLSAGIDPSAFPSGLSSVPVHLHPVDGCQSEMNLLAGFCGIGQQSQTRALYPIISWSVVNGAVR